MNCGLYKSLIRIGHTRRSPNIIIPSGHRVFQLEFALVHNDYSVGKNNKRISYNPIPCDRAFRFGPFICITGIEKINRYSNYPAYQS